MCFTDILCSVGGTRLSFLKMVHNSVSSVDFSARHPSPHPHFHLAIILFFVGDGARLVMKRPFSPEVWISFLYCFVFSPLIPFLVTYPTQLIPRLHKYPSTLCPFLPGILSKFYLTLFLSDKCHPELFLPELSRKTRIKPHLHVTGLASSETQNGKAKLLISKQICHIRGLILFKTPLKHFF